MSNDWHYIYAEMTTIKIFPCFTFMYAYYVVSCSLTSPQKIWKFIWCFLTFSVLARFPDNFEISLTKFCPRKRIKNCLQSWYFCLFSCEIDLKWNLIAASPYAILKTREGVLYADKAQIASIFNALKTDSYYDLTGTKILKVGEV